MILRRCWLRCRVAMTDARFPDRWLTDRRILRLSPKGFRSFVTLLTWSVSNRTDGFVSDADLTIVSPMFDPADVAEMIMVGLLRRREAGVVIIDFDATQTTSTQLAGLDHKRLTDRNRQARKRSHDAGDHSICLPEHCPEAMSRDNPRDATRDETRETKARQGKARQGITKGEVVEDEVIDEQTGEVLSIPAPVVNPDLCRGCGLAFTAMNRGCPDLVHAAKSDWGVA